MTQRILYLQGGAGRAGARISLLGLWQFLDRSRFAPYLVCDARGFLTEQADALNVPYEVVPLPPWRKWRSWLAMPLALARLSRIARRERVALIHSNDLWTTRHALWLARKLDLPAVAHVREEVATPHRARSYGLAQASRIIAVSTAVADQLALTAGLRERTVVVPNGVDVERYHPGVDGRAVRAECDLAPTDLVIGCVGVLGERKGQRLLLEAAASLLPRHPTLRVLLVGDEQPGYRRQLEQLAQQLGIADRVIFTGPRDDIPQMLVVIDLFALPTHREGFARVVLEAMAMAKPIVTTNVSGMREALVDGESGIIVPPGDAAALAAAIQKLLADPAGAEAMGQAARRRVQEHFSMQRYAQRVETVYHELLTTGRGGPAA